MKSAKKKKKEKGEKRKGKYEIEERNNSIKEL